jgi:hypothetical protein
LQPKIRASTNAGNPKIYHLNRSGGYIYGRRIFVKIAEGSDGLHRRTFVRYSLNAG